MLRILIVEDEDKVRKLHAELLESEGYAVVSVSDAVQASEILLKKHFDIILLDINLPHVYGSVLFDLMQVFHKSIEVIVTSVYPVEEQRKIMKDAAEYYDKAQGVDILLEKIKKVARSLMPLNTILIIEDGSHNYEDVMATLHKFSPFVTPNSYLIVEDGIVTELGRAAEFNGGPQKAVSELLKQNIHFVVDRKWCDFFGPNATFNTNGYLKKIS